MSEETPINGVGLCLGEGVSMSVTPSPRHWAISAMRNPGSPVLLTMLFDASYLPIISSIRITANSKLMNVNADQEAIVLAVYSGRESDPVARRQWDP